MRMHTRVKKLHKLKWPKQTVVICLLASVFVVTGIAYGYTTFRNDSAHTSQTKTVDEAKADTHGESDPSPTPLVDEPTSEDNDNDTDSKPVTTPPIQPKTNAPHGTAPEVYRPASLSVTEVRAFGDAYCDGTTYKLGLGSALIFSNGRSGTVQWRIEGQRNGAIETVATGSLQFAENQYTYEFPLYGKHYMTHPISTETGIRFRVTHPNDVSSQWRSPSEILSAESPCAEQY